jgi:hypothetical protein
MSTSASKWPNESSAFSCSHLPNGAFVNLFADRSPAVRENSPKKTAKKPATSGFLAVLKQNAVGGI